MQLDRNHVVFERFDDEIVAINLKTGIYYSISGSGVLIWELIEKNLPIESIKKLFEEKFSKNGNVGKDIDEFINKLRTEELVIDALNEDDQVKNTNVNQEWPIDVYETPVLTKYTDQREMLMLDPIHEVDDLGWPRKKK